MLDRSDRIAPFVWAGRLRLLSSYVVLHAKLNIEEVWVEGRSTPRGSP
ncbi:hypothetical protein QFZ98_003711 [Paraburkholderia youngii]